MKIFVLVKKSVPQEKVIRDLAFYWGTDLISESEILMCSSAKEDLEFHIKAESEIMPQVKARFELETGKVSPYQLKDMSIYEIRELEVNLVNKF